MNLLSSDVDPISVTRRTEHNLFYISAGPLPQIPLGCCRGANLAKLLNPRLEILTTWSSMPPFSELLTRSFFASKSTPVCLSLKVLEREKRVTSGNA